LLVRRNGDRRRKMLTEFGVFVCRRLSAGAVSRLSEVAFIYEQKRESNAETQSTEE